MSRIVFVIALLSAPLAQAGVSGERIIAADSEPESWLSHGRNYAEDRMSPLTQINKQNVKDLGLAWHFDTGTSRGLEASPLIIDGIIFSTGSWSKVFANNAKTGELLWSYDPQVPKTWGVNACCDVVNRGVAAWGDSVFVGTLDGRLVSLNRTTGAVQWDVVTIDKDRPYTITGAPRVVNGKVLIGNGGAEYGVRGYLSGYEAETGDLAWRFYTVPGNPADGYDSEAMRKAAATWKGDVYWKVGGGGTVWIPWPMTTKLTFSTLASATVRPGIGTFAVRGVVTTCSCHRSLPSIRTAEPTFGTTRRRRPIRGTTLRLNTSFSLTCR